jgi:hypothetical protein
VCYRRYDELGPGFSRSCHLIVPCHGPDTDALVPSAQFGDGTEGIVGINRDFQVTKSGVEGCSRSFEDHMRRESSDDSDEGELG